MTMPSPVHRLPSPPLAEGCVREALVETCPRGNQLLEWKSPCAAILVLILLSVVVVLSGTVSLHRPLWMDEVHSWILITDVDAAHSLRALSDGADYNPPVYFLFARMLDLLPGGVTEFSLRLLSAGIMTTAIVFTCLTLMRSFSPGTSLIAVIPIAAHPLVVDQFAEVRFYPLWCLLK